MPPSDSGTNTGSGTSTSAGTGTDSGTSTGAGTGTGTGMAHDVKLARISANGSVDPAFTESVGGGLSSSIGSGVHFSQPADNTELTNLFIVWSQPTESDSKEDEGTYVINAARFYENKAEDEAGFLVFQFRKGRGIRSSQAG